MRTKYNMHRILCNYVAANGPQSWTTLHKVVLTVAGRNINNTHWGVSYLDTVSNNTSLSPKRYDRRYLAKDPEDGMYHLVEA